MPNDLHTSLLTIAPFPHGRDKSLVAASAVTRGRHSCVVLDMLLWIFSEGLHLDARTDLEDLLLLLRQIHPRRMIVDTCEVRMLIKSQRWLDALRLLRQIDAQGYGSPVIAALQSWCLYRLADQDWKRCALEVLHSNDTAALAVVAKFLGIEGAGSAGVAEALRAKLWVLSQ
ncbi:type III secretion protein HrpB1 [Paraburkholderia sp. JPY465]|uniref:HrpB1 family type III secretion system apparatus protein n=1 Tax=Paraburkholderia sp. JPY465 TaxID=3042285 RepID=UPI003D1C8B11